MTALPGQMDGEAGWWTTSGNIGLPPLARAMGVGRQQQQFRLFVVDVIGIPLNYVDALSDMLEPLSTSRSDGKLINERS